MIDRFLHQILLAALQRISCVALTGPRQVGKTTLAFDIARHIPSVYLDLEDKLDLAKVQDMKAYSEANTGKLIILDEVQRLPEIFQPMRGIIDRARRSGQKGGQFLILGSASRDLLRQSGESLAGRISYVELFPVNVHEYTQDSTEEVSRLWLRGGFPDSLLASTDRDSLRWRRDFIRTYLERDIPQMGPRIAAETLDRFWTMLAHRQGTIHNASHLARSLDVSSVTVSRYLDLMVDLLLVRRLRPWLSNTGKRLVRSPKVYVRDSGITHALLNIEDINTLLGHPVAGGSWEGFVIENLLSVAPDHVIPYFYSSPGGAEIDLILEFGGGDKWAIEIKRHSAPALSKGFYVACDDIRAVRRFAVYSGRDSFSMGNDVIAIPLADLMKEVRQG